MSSLALNKMDSAFQSMDQPNVATHLLGNTVRDVTNTRGTSGSSIGATLSRAFIAVKNGVVAVAKAAWGYLQMFWGALRSAYMANSRLFQVGAAGFLVGGLVTAAILSSRRSAPPASRNRASIQLVPPARVQIGVQAASRLGGAPEARAAAPNQAALRPAAQRLVAAEANLVATQREARLTAERAQAAQQELEEAVSQLLPNHAIVHRQVQGKE